MLTRAIKISLAASFSLLAFSAFAVTEQQLIDIANKTTQLFSQSTSAADRQDIPRACGMVASPYKNEFVCP